MRTVFVLLLLTLPISAQHIAPTDPKSPADELKTFKLPPGFKAQLVASEPDIQKPMQHAFDAKGRLWVTTSYHYPFAAEKGKASDKLFILSDFGDDGKAKKIEIFDDKLNIPIGILPLPDCKSCIVSSVGEILKLTDTDGDGKADQREVLFTGFGTRDTHGMYNSFTMMPDAPAPREASPTGADLGWVYACHGFANDSTVKGKDGHVVKMHSGHTFRFRTDGSRIEIYTHGQVNPFGMTVDPWFNLYTADCHSKPITQLIKGAYYDSFGKPHDGLGYAPHVTRHDHGSTALCGLAWYDADQYPEQWKGCMFLGNVVTNRINADRIEWKGSTPVAKELPDFLVSSDPWFRPTDIKLGPDGALYVTDFYNKIIGHYEVDLKHPQRDKTHGRVWRIVYEGPVSNESKPNAKGPITFADRAAALAAMKQPDPHTVRAAVAYLADHPHPDLILTLAKFIPGIATDDTHLRHAARIALRNSLVAVKSQELLGFLLKPLVDTQDAQTACLDDVFFGVHHHHAGWWYSWRIEKRTIDPGLMARAAEHVGKYANDEERESVWKSIISIRSLREQIPLLTSMGNGLKAVGAKFKPKPSDQPRICETLVLKMNTEKPDEIEEALDFANLLNINLQYAPWFVAKDPKYSQALRSKALSALENSPVEARILTLKYLMSEPDRANGLIEPIIAMATKDKRISEIVSPKVLLKTSSYRDCVTIANGLSGSKSGAEELFATVKLGHASARLLQEKSVLERLKSTNPPGWERTVKELTAGIPSADARIAALIKERTDGYRKAKLDATAGKTVFANTCANCHQIAGQGAKIGPQLDGIGNRGVERLMEDTLDPNRNVDHAFHTTVLDLKDGGQLTGLLRVEGQTLIMIDPQAKETRVSVNDVDKKRTSPVSPMPSDIAEKLKPQEFYNLIAYLADLRAKQ